MKGKSSPTVRDTSNVQNRSGQVLLYNEGSVVDFRRVHLYTPYPGRRFSKEMYSRKDFLGTLLKRGALFGAGGMLTLGERSALAAQIETLYFEAESMSFSSLSGISVVSDSRANGSRVLMMTTESSAFKNNVTFWGAANEVRIMVRAQSSGASWPVVAILVDGREVGRWTISSTEADPYQLPSALISQVIPAGRHNVELRAVSGMSGSGTLWVDFIQFRRPEAQQPPPPGTVYFEDGFDRDVHTFTNWDRVHVMNNSATMDPTVVRRGTHSLKLSVQDLDSSTFGWSGVRSHLVKTNLFREGPGALHRLEHLRSGKPRQPYFMVQHGAVRLHGQHHAPDVDGAAGRWTLRPHLRRNPPAYPEVALYCGPKRCLARLRNTHSLPQEPYYRLRGALGGWRSPNDG